MPTKHKMMVIVAIEIRTENKANVIKSKVNMRIGISKIEHKNQ